MTRTYNVNLFFPIALAYLILLGLGVIAFTPWAVVGGIIISHAEINLTWSR